MDISAQRSIFSGIDKRVLLKNLLVELSSEITLPDLLDTYYKSHNQLSIPISIFSSNLYPLEALSLYLLTYENKSPKQISLLLNRDLTSIKSTIKRAKLKIPKNKQKSSIKLNLKIPLDVMVQSPHSIFSNVIFFLKISFKLDNKKIAKLLSTSANSIAVILKKRGRLNE